MLASFNLIPFRPWTDRRSSWDSCRRGSNTPFLASNLTDFHHHRSSLPGALDPVIQFFRWIILALIALLLS